MYFQCETNDSQEWLANCCGNSELKTEWKRLFRLLQPALNSYSNFEVEMRMTNSSKMHSIDTGEIYERLFETT